MVKADVEAEVLKCLTAQPTSIEQIMRCSTRSRSAVRKALLALKAKGCVGEAIVLGDMRRTWYRRIC
jgi:predicted transcriptional regulator